MRWSVLGVLTFVLAGVAVAAPEEGSSVIGRVLTPDGKPAARATVWLVANRWEVGHITVESTALTDAQGNFRLPFKPPLRVFSAYVIAHHPNFAVGWQSFDPRDLKPLTVYLRHPAPLAGIVLTPDGKPLTQAKLQVWEIESVRSRMAFDVNQVLNIYEEMPEEVSPFWTVTDSHGRFVFQNLPANAKVSLRVHHPDYSLSRIPPPSEWFPLQTGREWVTLVAVPKSFLKGQVLRDGRPVENAQVICRTEFYGEKEYHATTDANGEFEISFHRGRWLVYASAEDGRWQCEPQLILISPGQTVSVTLNLQRAVEVKGVVKDAETKNPVPFAEVYGDRELRMEAQGETLQMWWRPITVKTDENSNFRFFLLPGKWIINAWASYSPGHSAYSTKEVEVKGEDVELLELLLQSPPKLSVQVVDKRGKPVPKAIASDGWWMSWRADEKGFVRIEHTPQTLWAASPDLKMFGRTDVKPDEKTVRIVVENGIFVSGQVTGEDGKPVPNARLRVQALFRDPTFPVEMTNNWFEVFADNKGQFRFHLPSGLKFQLMALAEGYFPTATEPHVTESKPLTITVKMKRPNFVLEGKVVDDETGKPVWGAAVRVWLMLPGGSSPELGFRVAFTDEQGQFKLKDLRSEHLGEISVYHPAYRTFSEWRPIVRQQLLVRLERLRPIFTTQLAIGKPVPPLSDVKWLEGEAPSLQGKTTYLLFAMPYDPACEQAIQRLKELRAKSPEKVQVIVVFDASLPVEELRQYVGDLQLPFHFGVVPEGRLSGWDSETFQRYGVKSVPMLVVVDERGIVKAVNPERD